MKRVKDSIVQCFIVATAFTAALSFCFISSDRIFCTFYDRHRGHAIGTQMMHFLVPVYFYFICIEILSPHSAGLEIHWCRRLLPVRASAASGSCGFFAVPQNPTIENVMTISSTWVVTSLIFRLFRLYEKKRCPGRQPQMADGEAVCRKLGEAMKDLREGSMQGKKDILD